MDVGWEESSQELTQEVTLKLACNIDISKSNVCIVPPAVVAPFNTGNPNNNNDDDITVYLPLCTQKAMGATLSYFSLSRILST